MARSRTPGPFPGRDLGAVLSFTVPDEVEVVKVICTLHFRHVVPGPDDGVLRHTRSAGDGTCGSEWFIVRTDRVTDRAKAMVTAREHPVQAA